MKQLFYAATAALLSISAAASPVINLDFSKGSKVDLVGKAKIANGMLLLDGKKDSAKIPGGEKINITQKGFTLTATLKLDYDPSSKDLNHSVDMFFEKKEAFVFGKLHKQLYMNIYSQGRWNAHTVGLSYPEANQWTHVAAVVEYFYDPAQSDIGYKINLYLNGELTASKKILNLKPTTNNNPIRLGTGLGGNIWHLRGSFAKAAIYNRALTPAEIEKLCKAEKMVKIIRKGFYGVNDALKKQLDAIEQSADTPAKWAASALRRAADNSKDQQSFLPMAKALAAYKNASWETLAEKFTPEGCKIILNDKLALLFIENSGSGHPVAGAYDRISKREIFGERSIYWDIIYINGKINETIPFNSPDVSRKSQVSGNKMTVLWEGKGKVPFTAKEEIFVKGNRIESTFELKNLSKYTIDSVRYPLYTFASLGNGDKLVHPYMSGILMPNPRVEIFRHSQTGMYPSGRVTMQFGAYYSDAGGVYFGYEDPLARSKTYNVEGKRDNIHVSWSNPIIANKGENNFKLNGKAVIETFRGNWYTAGTIYRKFLEKEASWWIKELPRKSTPEWFRDNAFWLRLNTTDRQIAEDSVEQVKYFRKYFEVPFNIHWYEWNDPKIAGWPHFPQKEFTAETIKKLKALDVRILPYIDSRLWRQMDGPNGDSDWKYTSEGKKNAALKRDGSLNIEAYSKKAVYSVMCPASKPWQDLLVKLTVRMVNEGFNGIYHDQVGTGAPKLCFDPKHGHKLNDASMWLEQGYWEIFDRIFKILHKQDRSICHTTEENAEPYLKLMDGFVVCRFTDTEQIPLYQSIYSGRAQFVGRLFNCLSPGSPQSFFSKIAQQLVNSEQIGWFNPGELRDADFRRLYIKKAVHIRLALLYYFNEGRMLAPIDFGNTMPTERCLWSGYVPQLVTMPAIANSAWIGKDGSKMMLFTNTTQKDHTAIPKLEDPRGFWICREGAKEPVFTQKAVPVKLSGLTYEVWVSGSKERAEEIQKTLCRIASFDCGEVIGEQLKYTPKQSVGVPGKFYGVKDSTGHAFCNAAGSSHFGWIKDGALIAFSEIDFGSKGVSEFTVKVASPPEFASGLIEVFGGKHGKNHLATFSMPGTTGWKDFKEFTFKPDKPVKGKHTIIFRIKGNNACNFAGWSYK